MLSYSLILVNTLIFVSAEGRPEIFIENIPSLRSTVLGAVQLLGAQSSG